MLAELEKGPTRATGASENQLVLRKKMTETPIIEESKHEALEEMYFWPAVRKYHSAGDTLADEAVGQEQEAKHVLAELGKLEASDTKFEELLGTFIGAAREMRREIGAWSGVSGRARGHREWRRTMTTQESGTVTGTKDKDCNLIWYVEACLSNALRLETYIQDATREDDSELAGLFRKAQADSRKGAEVGKQLLRSRLASWCVPRPPARALRRTKARAQPVRDEDLYPERAGHHPRVTVDGPPGWSRPDAPCIGSCSSVSSRHGRRTGHVPQIASP